MLAFCELFLFFQANPNHTRVSVLLLYYHLLPCPIVLLKILASIFMIIDGFHAFVNMGCLYNERFCPILFRSRNGKEQQCVWHVHVEFIPARSSSCMQQQFNSAELCTHIPQDQKGLVDS